MSDENETTSGPPSEEEIEGATQAEEVAPEEDTATEETFSEEAPSEEIPAEEAPPEEAPPEEEPPEEAPTEEAPPEEASPKGATAKGTTGENAEVAEPEQIAKPLKAEEKDLSDIDSDASCEELQKIAQQLKAKGTQRTSDERQGKMEICYACYKMPANCNVQNHCIPNAACIQGSSGESGVFHLIVTIFSIMLFFFYWAINFWVNVIIIIVKAIKRIMECDREIQIGTLLLFIALIISIVIHAWFLQAKSARSCPGTCPGSYPNSRSCPGFCPGSCPGSSGGCSDINLNYVKTSSPCGDGGGEAQSSTIQQLLQIGMKDQSASSCMLCPQENKFTLKLFNQNNNVVYETSATIVLPRCSSKKPILNVIAKPFELINY